MNETTITLISVLLGSGILGAIVAAYKAIAERRKTEVEADAVGARTPAEVESVSVATMVNALNSARSINDDLRKDNDSLRQDFQNLNARFERSEQARAEDSRNVHEELIGLRQALQAAQAYIEKWIEWGQRVAPHEPQPDAPPGYRRI